VLENTPDCIHINLGIIGKPYTTSRGIIMIYNALDTSNGCNCPLQTIVCKQGGFGWIISYKQCRTGRMVSDVGFQLMDMAEYR